MPNPPPIVRPEATVTNVRIFPILGCSAWQVPHHVDWPIRETGLAWDGEWCIVPMGDDVQLDPLIHPRMAAIKPSLEVERGILRLVAPKGYSEIDTEFQELTISLSESPPRADHSLPNIGHRRADPYPSEAVAEFFTAVLGLPCTLARFEHYRRAAKTYELSIHESSLTVAFPYDAEPRTNITLSKSYNWQLQQYIRIGRHYFQLSASLKPGTTLTHLRNLYDNSPAAQNPTIRAGDQVQPISAEKGFNDLALQACIASTIVGKHICPVRDCRKDFVLAEELTHHLQVHKSRVRPMKSSRDLRKFIVERPRPSENKDAAGKGSPLPRWKEGQRLKDGSQRTSWRPRMLSATIKSVLAC